MLESIPPLPEPPYTDPVNGPVGDWEIFWTFVQEVLLAIINLF